MILLTASQECKSYGLTSLTQAAELFGCTTKALRDWHRDNPARFRIIMLGCAFELGLTKGVFIDGSEWVKK